MIRRHVIVHGFVQGVGFRYSASIEARRLAVTGWARNRRDGTVEVEIEGAEASVGAMLDWLTTGPPDAVVERTDVSAREPSGGSGFSITA